MARAQRSADDANTELLQVRVSKKADALLAARARAEALTVAGYLRRLIYRDVGLIGKKEA